MDNKGVLNSNDMISYAQNFEDVILHRVFRDRKDGFYIDVGAMDPLVESVTKFFYDEGWSGINIEPNEWFYSKLLQERPRDINLNLALGEKEENREIYLFEHIGNSTFDDLSRDRYVEKGFETKPKQVKVTTLATVCQDYVRRPIDFLKIDCEGWEKFVILGADWDRFRPILLIIEATEPGTATPSWSEWEPFLMEDGRYEMVYFDGLNRFYLRREYLDLRCHFEVPPNVFDEFTTYDTYQAHLTNKMLQRELDSLAARLPELEQKLNTVSAENLGLVESLHVKERKIREKSIALEAGEQAAQILKSDRDSLVVQMAQMSEALNTTKAQLAESLHAASMQAARDQAQIAQLQQESRELAERLQKTRLWVGQLSQDLVACRQQYNIGG
jgi:FkbM family methyltransferase